MQIKLIVVGKTKDLFLDEMIAEYIKRTNRFIKINLEVVRECNNNDSSLQKQLESEKVLLKTNSSDYLILLDETGKKFTSQGFTKKVKSLQEGNLKHVVFIIGGAYGFSDEIYKRANEKIALSDMTFTHQMVRIIFAEQLYRAFTIISNMPYHH